MRLEDYMKDQSSKALYFIVFSVHECLCESLK